MSDWKQHPLSAAYPAMADDEFEGLVQDIRENGLKESVVMFEGMVLDGWHRVQACGVAYAEIRTREFQGDNPQAYVISKNAHRRHLTQSQKAAAAARVYQWRTPGRPAPEDDKSAAAADLKVGDVAKAAGVSERTLRNAAAAERAGLGDDVRDGRISAEAAAEKAREANGAPPKPPKKTPLEKAQDEIAELKAELADERETKQDVLDSLESYVDSELSEDDQRVKFEELRKYNSTLQSQVREWQNIANQWKRECLGLRRKLGIKA